MESGGYFVPHFYFFVNIVFDLQKTANIFAKNVGHIFKITCLSLYNFYLQLSIFHDDQLQNLNIYNKIGT